MISSLVLSFVLSFSLDARAEIPSNFWGYRQINQTITDRLIEPTSGFKLYRYLGAEKLTELLGFQPNTLGSEFRNGVPNSTNMLLWSVAFELFAEDVSSACTKGSSNLGLNDSFAKIILEFCGAKVNPQVLERLWLAVMSYDAPYSEFEVWRDYVLASAGEPEAVLKDSMFTILMNPHFLVRK